VANKSDKANICPSASLERIVSETIVFIAARLGAEKTILDSSTRDGAGTLSN